MKQLKLMKGLFVYGGIPRIPFRESLFWPRKMPGNYSLFLNWTRNVYTSETSRDV
jgi:hypothetical protein